MPYNTVINFVAGDPLAAADLNSNFDNLDYLNAKINSEIQISGSSFTPVSGYASAYGEAVMGSTSLTYRFMDFADTGGQLIANAGFVLPSDYDGGTITARALWTANSTSTNSVVWGFRAVAVADDGALDATLGTAVEVTDANKATAYDLNITAESSAITIAGTPTAGKYCMFVVYRDSGDANDNLGATARLLAVVITYTRS